MKSYNIYISILSIFLSCILFCACSRDFKDISITGYLNKSEHAISMEFHKPGTYTGTWISGTIEKDSLLLLGRDLSNKKPKKLPIIAYEPTTDSVVVIFGKSKRLVFLSKSIEKRQPGYVAYDDPRSLMNEKNYERNIPEAEQPKSRFPMDSRFTFIKEDYDKAIECNGNCE